MPNPTPSAPETEAAANAESERLDKSLVHGIAWSGAAKWTKQALSWLATIIVARLLTPDDYGLVSMAAVYLGLITMFSEFGLGVAVVTLRDLTEEQVAQLNGLSVLFGASGFALSCIAAMPLGRFFHAPRLPAVLIIMSLGFVILSFQSIPAALLQKDLRFKKLSIIEAVKGTVQALGMMVMAFLGAGYWTLVYGGLLGASASVLLIVIARPCRMAWPKWSALSAAIRFSWRVLVSRIAWYGYSNADFVVAGRVLGQAPLGDYTLAWNLANAPLENVTTLVGGVTPAYYAAVQDDAAALRRYLLRPVEAISMVIFPLLVGLALVSKEAVIALLGRKWEGAVVPLSLLCIYGCVRAVMPLFAQVLTVVGDAGFVMWTAIVSCIVLPPAFLAGSRWGPAGIAAAWVIAYPVNAVPQYLRLRRRIRMTDAEFLRALWPAAHGALVVLLFVGLLKAGFVHYGRSSLPTRLIAEVAVGAAAYAATLLLFHRERIALFRRAIGGLRK